VHTPRAETGRLRAAQFAPRAVYIPGGAGVVREEGARDGDGRSSVPGAGRGWGGVRGAAGSHRREHASRSSAPDAGSFQPGATRPAPRTRSPSRPAPGTEDRPSPSRCSFPPGNHACLPVYTPPAARTGRLAGAQFPGTAVYALPTAPDVARQTVPRQLETTLEGLTMESSAWPGAGKQPPQAASDQDARSCVRRLADGPAGCCLVLQAGTVVNDFGTGLILPSRSSTCTRRAASQRQLRGWCWRRSWARRRS